MELVQRRDTVADRIHSCATLFVPPLVASPDLSLQAVVVALDVFLEHERLSKVQQLSLAACCLRVACDELVFF